jgi:hypothetical protein
VFNETKEGHSKTGHILNSDRLASIAFVVVRTFVKVALHTVHQFRSKTPLDLPPTQSSGYPRTMLPMIGIRRTGLQMVFFGSVLLTPALFEFPTVHGRPPFRCALHSGFYIGLPAQYFRKKAKRRRRFSMRGSQTVQDIHMKNVPRVSVTANC